MEQRCHAVMEVVSGAPVTEVASCYGVARQAVHNWLGKYKEEGLAALADHSHRPHFSPRQLNAGIEAVTCQLRAAHPRWGPRRMAYELDKANVTPVPSRSTIYRVLVRHGLVPAANVSAAARLQSVAARAGRCSCGSWTSPGLCS